jgi:hypothetical protein
MLWLSTEPKITRVRDSRVMVRVVVRQWMTRRTWRRKKWTLEEQEA